MSSLRMAWMMSVLNFSPMDLFTELSLSKHTGILSTGSPTLIPLPPDTSHLPPCGARAPASEGIGGSDSLAQRKENNSNHSHRYFLDFVH